MEIVCIALQVYGWILFARVILSWVTVAGARPPSALGPVIKFVYDVTEPILKVFRNIIPPAGPLDLSVLILFLLLGAAMGVLGCGGFF